MRLGIKRVTFEYDGQEAWVEIRKPTVKELLDFAQQAEKEPLPAIHSLLGGTLVAWNFEDAKGKDLPVKPETIRQLPGDLLVVMVQRIQEVLIDVPLARKGSSQEPSS